MTSLLDDSRKPDITFHSSGRIDITARVVKLLEICQGDVIDVMTDGLEYMLYVRHRAANISGAHEAQCYPTNRGRRTRNFRCHSRRLCQTLIAKVKPSASELRLTAGELVNRPDLTCKVLVPLITRNPL